MGDLETSFDGAPIEFVNANGQGTDEALAKSTRLDYSIENIGASVGYKVSDTFSLGLSVAYSDFSIDSYTVRFSDGYLFNQQRQQGSDNDIVYTLGALWNINPQWNLGLAYRTGGDFDYRASNEVVGTTLRLDLEPEFSVPNVFSLGLAYRPSHALLFTLDVNRIEYSRLSDGIESIFANPRTPLSIDDATEVHLGVEYAFLEMATPMFLRGGLWRDPDHRLAYDGAVPASCNVDTFNDCLAAVLYPRGDDEMHYSVGLGWSFQKFQLDLAADLSDLVDTYSVSGVLRFVIGLPRSRQARDRAIIAAPPPCRVSMHCIVYRSTRRPDTYVYVADAAALERLPPALKQALGPLSEALQFELTPERRLAREDARRVLENIAGIGYHVQFPPAERVPLPDPTS